MRVELLDQKKMNNQVYYIRIKKHHAFNCDSYGYLEGERKGREKKIYRRYEDTLQIKYRFTQAVYLTLQKFNIIFMPLDF